MRSLLKGTAIISTLALVPVLVGAPVSAADVTPESVLKRVEELQRTIEAQQEIIAAQQRRLLILERHALTADKQLQGLIGKGGAAQEAVFVAGRGKSVATPAQTEGEAPAPVAPVAPDEEEPKQGETPSPTAPVADEPAPVAPTETPEPTAPAAEETKPEPKPDEGKLVEERPEDIEKPREELLLEAGAVLLPPGTLQIEPWLDYTHTSSDRVNILGFTIFEAIVIGLIRVDEIERDIVRPGVNLRYGLFDRFQLEATVPGVYRSDTEILGVGTPGQAEVQTDNFDIGDVEIGGAYQLFAQQPWIPATVLRLRARLPTGVSAFEIGTTTINVNEAERTVLEETATGSGFYAASPGATFIWRADPVAFFGGGSYTVNFSRNQGNFGNIDPGDTIEAFAGMNVALSDRVGFNLSFVDQFTSKTVQNDIEQAGSSVNDARLTVGASYGLSPDFSILASASVGLTEESPDFVFLLSTPISFDLY